MRDPFSDSPEFQRLVHGDESVDLVRINLEVARDADPAIDPQACLAAIDAIADRVRSRCASDASATRVIGQINWALFVEDEYRGNSEDYFDPRNSYLHEVIQRRLGIPISLAILYAAIAGRLGLRLDGVNTPLHFLLRVTDEEPALFVDPFHEGNLLDRTGCEQLLSDLSGQPIRLSFEHFTPCRLTTVVARMLGNLKRIYLDRREFHQALPVVRRLAALNPRDLADQRDWGLVAIQMNRPGEAISPLAQYLAGTNGGSDRDQIHEILHQARRDVAAWN